MTYAVVKNHKHLHVAIKETGEIVYSLPFWLRSQLLDRQELVHLADAFNDLQRIDIEVIIAFEAMLRRRLQKEEA